MKRMRLFDKNLSAMIWRILITAIMVYGYAAAMPLHPQKADDAAVAGKTVSYTADVRQAELRRGINAPSIVSGAPKSAVSGSFRALAVLIEFSDHGSSVAPEEFDTLLFENVLGTVNNYYSSVSYGQLDIVTLDLPSSIGWVTAPQTYAYYVNGERGTGAYPNNTQRLCEDIAAAVDSLVDFSDYDNDSDGYVDALIMIHSGPGYEYTFDENDIHSHKWAIWPPQLHDDVYVFEYTIQPEYWNTPGDMTCGVYCHELGHIFGLPDLYDTDYTSRGVGLWSLMASGSWLGPGFLGSRPAEPDAWSRIELGFKSATNLTSNADGVSISNIQSGGPIYRLWSGGAVGNEYYLVENRQKSGYDTYLPGAGLLIWHIDETIVAGENVNNDEWYPGYTDSGHYGVALEQADGLFQLEKLINSGNDGDPFPGSSNNTSFSPFSIPGSNSYAGGNTYVSVTNISTSGPIMTADLDVSFALDVAESDEEIIPGRPFLEQNLPNPFNATTTISVNLPGSGFLRLDVFDILGRRIKTLLDGHYAAGTIAVDWDGTDRNGQEVSSGVYFYKATMGTEQETRKMTLVK